MVRSAATTVNITDELLTATRFLDEAQDYLRRSGLPNNPVNTRDLAADLARLDLTPDEALEFGRFMDEVEGRPIDEWYDVLDELECGDFFKNNCNLIRILTNKFNTDPTKFKFLGPIIKGLKFEDEVVAAALLSRRGDNWNTLKTRLSGFGKNLDEYEVLTNVYLRTLDGKTTVIADQVLVKFGRNAQTDLLQIEDVVVLENKLNIETRPSSNQRIASMADMLEIRSRDGLIQKTGNETLSDFFINDLNSNFFDFNRLIGNGLDLNTRNSWLKVSDGENGDVITSISLL